MYDPFASTCRVISCPPGSSLSDDGQCVARRWRSRGVNNDTPDGPSLSAVDDDCASWIQLDRSEYRLLSNESAVHVPLHGTTYGPDSYELGDNDTVHVCTAFGRNYSDAAPPAALRVDVVGAHLSVVLSAVSLLALAFQFSVYMSFPALRNTPGRCVVCLVVSLFVAQLLFVVVKLGRSVSRSFCFVQAVTMHAAFTAAFFWMNVMAFDVYRTFGAASPAAAAAASSSSSGARRRFARYVTFIVKLCSHRQRVAATGNLLHRRHLG